MRRGFLFILVLFFLGVFCFTSCTSTSSLIERFSLDVPVVQEESTKILTGTINYGAGFYFPSSNDILDISLLKTDSTTGTIQEISHQRIRNIQRFPLQFSVRYDKNDITDGDSCSLLVSFSVDGSISAQGMVQLEYKNGNFSEAFVTLSAVAAETNALTV